MKIKNKISKFFTLSWKKVAIAFVVFVVSVFLHNLVYGLGIYFFGENFWGVNGDEAFFFIIATVLVPLYLIISIIYCLIKKIKRRKMK